MPRRAAIFAALPVASQPTPLARSDAWQDGAATMREACAFLRLSRSEVHRYLREGKLHSVKIGNRRRFSRRELSEFLARQAR